MSWRQNVPHGQARASGTSRAAPVQALVQTEPQDEPNMKLPDREYLGAAGRGGGARGRLVCGAVPLRAWSTCTSSARGSIQWYGSLRMSLPSQAAALGFCRAADLPYMHVHLTQSGLLAVHKPACLLQ